VEALTLRAIKTQNEFQESRKSKKDRWKSKKTVNQQKIAVNNKQL